MITTTLNRIREQSLRQDSWERLLAGLGKTAADDEPSPFATILEINGLMDALWCCRAEPQYAKEWRLLMVAYARRAQHLNIDSRIRNAINVAERFANGCATDKELHEAWLEAVAASYEAQRFRAGTLLSEIEKAAAEAAALAASPEPQHCLSKNALWAASGFGRSAMKCLYDKRGIPTTWSREIADEWEQKTHAAFHTALDAEFEWQAQEFLRVVTETEARET